MIDAEEEYRNSFFGTSHADAGSTTTDASGNFAIIPYAFDYTYNFDITASKSGPGRDGTTLYKADIIASGASDVYTDTLFLHL